MSSSHPALRAGRLVLMALIALLVLTGGWWASWSDAQHVMFAKGREHGVFSVTSCSDTVCAGSFDPDGPAPAESDMTVVESVAAKKGLRFPAVVKPGTHTLVRDDTAGVVHTWVPLGGALLLAALVVGGGMRLGRVAMILGLLGLGELFATFLLI